jgi:hypothetical protein
MKPACRQGKAGLQNLVLTACPAFQRGTGTTYEANSQVSKLQFINGHLYRVLSFQKGRRQYQHLKLINGFSGKSMIKATSGAEKPHGTRAKRIFQLPRI